MCVCVGGGGGGGDVCERNKYAYCNQYRTRVFKHMWLLGQDRDNGCLYY